jgi:hypothetical protein
VCTAGEVFGYRPHYLCWSADTGQELQRVELPAYRPTCFAVSPDGRTLAFEATQALLEKTAKPGTASAAASPHYLVLWETRTGKARRKLIGHDGAIDALAFASDGTLASVSQDLTILLWEGIKPTTGATVGPLSPKDVQERWELLASAEGERAYDAVCDLVRSPEAALALLEQKLLPVRVPDQVRLANLIRDLQSEKFKAREAANRELEALGEGAVPALRQALAKRPPLEMHRRLEQLLEKLDAARTTNRLRALRGFEEAPERIRTLRAVEVLEWIGSPGARRHLEKLAAGVAETQLTHEARAALKRMEQRTTK